MSLTVTRGEQFPAKFRRIGFRRNFSFQTQWRGQFYATKQLTAIAAREGGWLACRHRHCPDTFDSMKLTYDPRHNIGYLRFHEKTAEVETIQVSDALNVDIAPDGTVYGSSF
jgi:Protein of unknown function (DUF2283)